MRLARERLVEDEWVPYVFLATVFVLYAVYEWLRWYFQVQPQPKLVSIIALIAVGCLIYKYFGVRRRVKAFRLGEEGEREVGHFLEGLRAKGCQVFHDIVGGKFNIDHLIVSPRGIFLIETSGGPRGLDRKPGALSGTLRDAPHAALRWGSEAK